MQMLEEEVQEKKEKVRSFAGETILRGEDFKRYVNQLRGKSNVYKARRSELAELKAEAGVLARTAEVLKVRAGEVAGVVSNHERDRGVQGYRGVEEQLERVAKEKAEVDEEKGRTLEEMSGMVTQLTMKIGERKARLAPIIKELRPLRQQSADMQLEYDEKKQGYDTLLLQLESGMSRLEQEVKKTQEEIISNETKYHTMEMQMVLQELWQERAQTELKTYVASSTKNNDSEQPKRISVREQLLKTISEKEKRSKLLKEEQRKVKENLVQASRQVNYFPSLMSN